MKRHKLALIGILVVFGVVLLVDIVDIPFFMDKISSDQTPLFIPDLGFSFHKS